MALGSDERFASLLQKLSKKEDAPSVPRDQTFWNDAAGRRLAVIQMTESRCTLQIDRRDEPGFANFVVERLNDLYRDYEAAKSSGAS